MKIPKNISSLTVYELRTIVKRIGHSNPSKLKKKELESYINKNRKSENRLSNKVYLFFKNNKFIISFILTIIAITFSYFSSQHLKDQIAKNKTYLEEVQLQMPSEFFINLEFNFDIPSEVLKDYRKNKEDWIYQNLKYIHFNIDLNTKKYLHENNLPAIQIITKYKLQKELDKKYIESSWLEKHHQFKLKNSSISVVMFRMNSTAIFNDGEIKTLKDFCGNDLTIRATLEFYDNSIFEKTPSTKLKNGSMTTPDGKTLRFDIKRNDWYVSTETRSDSCWMFIRDEMKK